MIKEEQDHSFRNTLIIFGIIGILLTITIIIFSHEADLEYQEKKRVMDKLAESVYNYEKCDQLIERLNIDSQYWLKEKDEILTKVFKEKNCEVKP